MRRLTEHDKRLHRLYLAESGRLQGPPGWEKFPLFWFLLFLSYKCTRRCSYCYAFNQVGDGNTAEMDENTFARLVEWIPEVWRANNVKVNVIVFLGGEPLLRTDRIKRVMEAAYRHTDGMQGNVTTNSDLVDTVNWDDLEDIQWITTNIADNSLAELARRMRIIKERSNVVGQTVAATLEDENLARVVEIARFGVENGYRLRFARNLFRGLDAEYKRRLLAKYHEVCDLLEGYLARGHDVRTTFLFDNLIPGWPEASSPHLCGKRVATVFPDGAVGPCIRNQSFKTGTIFDADPMRRIQSDLFHYDLSRPDLPAECKGCEARSICHGGCPNDKLLLTGKVAGRSVICDIHREIVPRLKTLERLHAARGADAGKPSIAEESAAY
jgi:radical SAM protein with 4Fe4S-binding SPASM domain